MGELAALSRPEEGRKLMMLVVLAGPQALTP